MLDENSEWMPAAALRSQVNRLNSRDDPSPLSIEWEVAVLNALSKYVRITHEPDLCSRPDILYEVGGETVIADVTAVSDRSTLRANPADELTDEFFRRLAPLLQSGLRGSFGLNINEASPRARGKDKAAPSLRIPARHKFKRIIFNENFNAFLRKLRHSPNESHTFRVNHPECGLSLSFHPGGSGWTVMKVRCDQTTLLRKNPLWNALDEKRRKLTNAKIAARRGIIVCDADCAALKGKGDWDQYGADEIIREFLRAHRSISFVVTLIPRHKGGRLDLNARNHELTWQLFSKKSDAAALWLSPIMSFAANMPQIQNTAANARYRAEWKKQHKEWHQEPGFRGAMRMSRGAIRFSARDLLELMAGTLKQEQFQATYARGVNVNPFLQKLANGQLMTSARIEKHDIDADDDWIVFEFGNPDPAVSAFRERTSDVSSNKAEQINSAQRGSGL
ncbi:MAG: hypothetical protein ABSC62_00080 [Terracidiphilus sp.]|jgi:hypothetical protein